VSEGTRTSRAVSILRRFIYSRWFYAALAFVCLLDVTAEILDILDPGENLAIDLVSLITSSVAAVLAFAVLIDLHIRRPRS
jgi:hypothetical protein